MFISFFSSSMLHCASTRPLMFACGRGGVRAPATGVRAPPPQTGLGPGRGRLTLPAAGLPTCPGSKGTPSSGTRPRPAPPLCPYPSRRPVLPSSRPHPAGQQLHQVACALSAGTATRLVPATAAAQTALAARTGTRAAPEEQALTHTAPCRAARAGPQGTPRCQVSSEPAGKGQGGGGGWGREPACGNMSAHGVPR